MMASSYAPISVGNFIVGFDSLGAALKPADGSRFGDIVRVQESNECALLVRGSYAGSLPDNPRENIVFRCMERFSRELERYDVPDRPLLMVLEKNLPVCSGLGSSAASIVASLVALNVFFGQPLKNGRLLELSGEMEGLVSGGAHFDNVVPCLMGGLRLMMPPGGGLSMSLPFPVPWRYVICHPGTAVSTCEARAILRKTYTLGALTGYGSRLASFVGALYSGDDELAASLMVDEIAEPRRRSLVRGFDKAKKAAMKMGALAFGLSGSGPSCIAVCPDLQSAFAVERSLSSVFSGNPASFTLVCEIDESGARVVD